MHREEAEMKNKMRVWVVLISALVLVIAVRFWAQEICTEYEGFFTENFDTVDYKDIPHSSVAHWPSGPVTLNFLGANFQVAEPTGMGARIYVCDSGDFDGDGYPDLIGLDIGTNYRLILIRNEFEDNNGDGVDDDGVIFQIDPNEVYDDGLTVGPASITTGDYNNDGLIDFFFMKNRRDEFGYTDFVAAMYINTGTASDPDFSRHDQSPNLDFSSRFRDAGISINWAADHLESADIDGDGDMDILAISQDKIFLIRNPGQENFNLGNFEIAEINYDQRTGFSSGRGGSSVAAGDIDGDGDIDIVGGSVNDYDYLVYYVNDGTGNFTRNEIVIPNSNATGTVATAVGDFNQDGRLDIFGATDRWNAGNEARMWLMVNNGISEGPEPELQIEFRCLNNCDPILPPTYDVDMSSDLDYDQDGDVDMILADANNSGDFYLVKNEVASVYALAGEARSTNLAGALDPNRYAVTKVTVSNLQMDVVGGSKKGLAVNLYVSNNGSDWELYQTFEGNDIHNYSDLPPHTFLHFGPGLHWKALLSADEDEMAEYNGASFETPRIAEIQLAYVFVERQEYSRTSIVVSSFLDDSGQQKKLLIAGSFIYPGWLGQLRAYDTTNISSQSSSAANIRTISRSDLTAESGREVVAEGVEILWDAGQLLDARSASDRTIYTAVPSGDRLARMDFSVSNVGVLGPLLQDVNNDNAGLIGFVRGEERDWKLGDINHSNPLVVGPPSGDPDLKGDGYEDFAAAWENRPKYIYVGANDGMLHCFDLKTGTEHWAFIPYNLLPKLRNMWAVDDLTQERYFVRDTFVDGTPSVSDVYIDADGDGAKEWVTILVCGQGPGQGSTVAGGTTGNFYFALDITNPDDPRPLWEFTHRRMGETWSVPVFGKIQYKGNDTWAAFMGSGYDNVTGQGRQGHVFYAVRAEDGVRFWSFGVKEKNTKKKWSNKKNVIRSIPASPAIIDIDSDGYADSVYVGDTEGRMWKVDISIPFRKSKNWKAKKMYEDRHNYPIITKPALWRNSSVEGDSPRLYFGTGGDDLAPADGLYSFVSLIDNHQNEVEWFIGDADDLHLSDSIDKGDLAAGDKIWGDAKIANSVVYFSTLFGSIESVDPCENLTGQGKFYGRYVDTLGGSVIGSSSFGSSGGQTQESLNLEIKTRAAVSLGERQTGEGGGRSQEVYIQEYNSTIQKLEQSVNASLRVRSWREVYKIIRLPFGL